MNTGKLLTKASAILLLLFTSMGLHAQLTIYESRETFDSDFPGSLFENWDSYPNGTIFPQGTGANGITYFTNTNASVLVNNIFLNSSPPNNLGLDATNAFSFNNTVTFVFDTPKLAFGIDINSSSPEDNAYRATIENGLFADSFVDHFPFASDGHFLGFSAIEEFSSVTLSSNVGFFSYVLDTIRTVEAPPGSVPFDSWLLPVLGVLLCRLNWFKLSCRGSA